MLSMSNATSPLSHLSPVPPLSQTWGRLLHLDSLVELSPATFWQYNDMSFHSHYFSSASPDGILDGLGEEDGPPSVGGENESVLSTEEESKSSLFGGDYFCDCSPSMEAMDFFEEFLTPLPLYNVMFDMSTLCLPEKVVRCDYHNSFDVVSSPVQNCDPIPKGIIGASM